MSIPEFLNLLSGVKKSLNGWDACCPAHKDNEASLSIKVGTGGKIVLHCHANCTVQSVVTALGLRMADLFPDRSPPKRTAKGRIVTTYDYTDESGKLLFQSVRYDPKNFSQRRPDPSKPGQHIWNLNGVGTVLYRLPELKAAIAAKNLIYIAEGEKDVDALVKTGFAATCNPMGAGKWLPQYNETLRGASVCIIADKDKAGRDHAQMVANALHEIAASVRVIELPDVKEEAVKDAYDFFAASGTQDQIQTLYKNAPAWTRQGPSTVANANGGEPTRPLRATPPQTPMDFHHWQEVITANFPAFVRPAEICASVFAQLLLNDVSNPFALALVDVPSSGKTITLNFFNVPDLAYTTDNFTPASFVSHASNVKRDDLSSVDLLPRIRFRTLVVRDMAPIFGVKEDELLKTMGILTRVLDGEGLETDGGVHGRRGYKGDWLFMLLAGTTPIPPRVFKIMGTLGSRLFFLSLRATAKSEEELIDQNRGKSRLEKERVCQAATKSFMLTLWAEHPGGVEWNKNGDPDGCLRVIARCAQLLAALRGMIQVWQSEKDGSMSHNIPVIEQPDRINCLLCNLARGHALLRGASQVEIADMAPVLEVTFDSAPTIRAKVFRALVEHGGVLKTSQVENVLRCSKPTAHKEMEALAVLGVADKVETGPEYGRPEHELRLVEKFKWFATADAKALRWPGPQTQGGNP